MSIAMRREIQRVRERSGLGRSRRVLVAALAAIALAGAACATADEGPVEMARATWNSGHMQAAIYAELIRELGHEVTDPAQNTLDPNGFYPALANGQYDLWANGWFPLHDFYLEGELVTGQSVDLPIQPVGFQVRSGALQGYMIDKATADTMGINSMSQLADASVAAVFDRDGDGAADLMGCNEGWGCHSVIDQHLAELDWGANVEHVSGDYDSLIGEVVDRVADGEPALFYAWTPNWTYEKLTPGDDVVWLESPALEGTKGSTSASGLRGCASDPCDLGWAVSSIQAVANENFLKDNPDIKALLELVSIPLADIATQNAKMADAERGYTNEQIREDAVAWISANRDTVDDWLTTARNST